MSDNDLILCNTQVFVKRVPRATSANLINMYSRTAPAKPVMVQAPIAPSRQIMQLGKGMYLESIIAVFCIFSFLF